METASIIAISDLLTQVSESLDAYQKYHKENTTDMDAYSYGPEHEYNIKSLIAGIKNILTDLTYLTRAHNLFLKLSTYSNRNEIKNHLSNLNINLKNKNSTSIAIELDWLKTHLRTYCLRLDKNRYLEFNTAIDELCRKAILLEDTIKATQKQLSSTENIYSEIQSTQEKYNTTISELTSTKDSFSKDVKAFTDEFGEFQILAQRAQENETKIAENLEAANKKIDKFNEFIEKINEREKILSRQNELTIAYESKLENYAQEHISYLNEAQRLIKEAKIALNYKNAEGLSAAFSNQLTSVSKLWKTGLWLFFSAVFIIATLFIGIWVIVGWGINENANQNQMILNLVGRLSMIPLTITGAIFCANQYVKQKNIIEDYAYKTTIAKSIIAFSEELREKSPEKYTEYISTVLKEIHQDPLRKRGRDKDEFTLSKDSTGLIEKVIALLQSAINK